MNLKGGLEGEDLSRSLKQLIRSFEPHIREGGSLEQVEENLQHLEESDENFHRYELVKQLKHKIDEVVGPLIDDEIERFSPSGYAGTNGQDTMVTRITDSVLQSNQYQEFNKVLKKNVQEGIDIFMQNIEFELGTPHGDTAFQSRRNNETDDEDGSVMMFDPDYMKHIADSLQKNKPIQTKREALGKINQIISTDSLNSEHWPQLKRNLELVMHETDEQLSALSLKFIAKAFTSTTPQTREIYILLMEFLLHEFQTSSSIPHVKAGLEVTRPEITKLLRKFRLMNEFQQEAPNYWIRYPDKYLEEIVESTLNLIAVHHSSPTQRLTPLHFIALLDPRAQWFIKWMHGNYSRKVLLETMQKYRPIVEHTVKHCLEFSEARKMPLDALSEVSDSMSKFSINSGEKRTYYTGAELDYVYFVHCVGILGRMLCFKNGRKFFPLELKDERVTINRLLKALVQLIVDPGNTASLKYPSSETMLINKFFIDQFEPCKFITEVMKDLCTSESVCEICLCNDEFTNTLLAPIFKFLDNNLENQAPTENTLLHVADILSILASNSRGRSHLLYGQGGNLHNRSKSSAAHVIAEFTKKALSSTLPTGSGSQPSVTVVGAYLYICRQFYNTCEGLLVLHQYDLHNTVAKAWREASQAAERAATPTQSHKDFSVLTWEDTLRDNLLNFASTAKGILLLQLTGAINECVSYMYTRYEKKLQVSKCEKFGYGVMVTQMAATAPGMVALQNTGYIKALMTELWSSLECGPSDDPVFTPKTWPVDTIDRISHKHLIRLMNILSGFPAVYEVLAEKPLPVKDSYSFREMPDTVDGLIDRLVMMDSPAKMHSLFNYEQSHAFGLRVLGVMTSCLDTYLLLQSQYKFQEVLLQAQADNKTHAGSDQIIVDLLSVERNFLLVKTHLIGGPTERMIPQRLLEQIQDGVYPYPLFDSYPLPREYSPNLAGRTAMKQDNELSKFLSGKGERRMPWLEKGRSIFFKLLSNKPDQAKGSLMQQFLEQMVTGFSNIPEEATFPLLDFSADDSSVKKFTLSPLQQLGIKTVIRYGMHLKALNTSSDATDNLTKLLKQTGFFLKQQQKVVRSPFSYLILMELEYLSGGYPGFDWFAATVFLIFHGNTERAWKFLYKFSSLGVSGYLWMPRLHASVHLPQALMMSGIPPMFSSTAHNIEFIMQTELPLVTSAFKMSGYTPAQICVHWLKQCFWNYLDWGDICHYVCTCIVMGADYQVYTCVSILRHIQQDILHHMQTQDLIIFLKEEPIRGFRLADNIRYMQELEKRFRKMVLPDMMNITKP